MKISNGNMLPLLLLFFLSLTAGQLVNHPPQFVPGTGDMSRFSLSENTPVGSPVFQLKGEYHSIQVYRRFSMGRVEGFWWGEF